MRVALLFPEGFGHNPGSEAGSALFQALRADLELDSIIAAMSGGDRQLAAGISAALAASTSNDVATVRHRQAVLRDALANPEQMRALHGLARHGAGATGRSGRGLLGDWSAAIASQAITTLTEQVGVLGDLRDVLAAGSWGSVPMRDLAAQAQRELDRDYLAELAAAITALRPGATLVAGARLGWGNEGSQYVLRRGDREQSRRWPRLPRGDRETIRFDDRDEGTTRALASLRDEVTGSAAGVLAAAAGNIGRFLAELAEQTALYVGALNLAGEMAARGVAATVPEVVAGDRGLGRFTDLVDLALALSFDGPVVANTVAADEAKAIIVTGANQGGKSTFLRSLGQAQLMAQAGLAVAASQWTGSSAAGLYTHFTREEDRSMRSGRLDDELARLDEIVAQLRPGAIVLLNESLSSTNEREGSALAGQVVGALIEAGVRVAYVTHLYEFAAAAAGQPGYLMLRASRNDDGSRSFRLEEGQPTQTSHGMDLYDQIIGVPS